MEYQVSSAVMIMMSVALVAGIVIPVLLFLFMHFKWKCKAAPFFVGCGTFFLFAGVLERILHSVVFGVIPGGSDLLDNIWLYGLYGALAAGVFEETGRFLAMKFVLKKYHGEGKNALMYGAGHGGFEAFYVLGIGMISNLAMAYTINSGLLETQFSGLSDEMYEQLLAQVQTLCTTSPWMFGVGILERFMAIAGHICFSVVVWIAATRGGKLTWFYPVGILLHFLLDFVVVIINSFFGIAAAELCTLVMVVLFALIARRLYGKYCGDSNLLAQEE